MAYVTHHRSSDLRKALTLRTTARINHATTEGIGSLICGTAA